MHAVTGMEEVAPGEEFRRIRINGRETVIRDSDIYDAEFALEAFGLEDPKSETAQSLPSAQIGRRRMFSGHQLIQYLDRLFEEGASDANSTTQPASPKGNATRRKRRPR